MPLVWLHKRRRRKWLRSTDEENLVAVIFDNKPLQGITYRDHIEEFPFWVECGVQHIWEAMERLPTDFALVTSPTLLFLLSRDDSFVAPRYDIDVLPLGSYKSYRLYVDPKMPSYMLHYVGAGKRLGTFQVVNW